MSWIYFTQPNIRQQGIATLLLTALMLSIALMVVGRSALITRYQLADVQQEIKRSQSFWKAEGELECLWTQERSAYAKETLPVQCQQVKHETRFLPPDKKLFTVTAGTTTLQKYYRLSLPDLSGVVKATSHLILTDNASFAPDPGHQLPDGRWACVVLRYKYDFSAPSVTTYHPEQLPYPLYRGFPSQTEQRCAGQYHTVASRAQAAKSDYLYTPTLSPFRDLFGVDVQQWFQVMSHPRIGRVPESLDNSVTGQFRYTDSSQLPVSRLNPDCATQIEDVISHGKMIIWVYGGCVLSDPDIQQINRVIQAKFPQQGIILLIQDGLVGIKSQHSLQGMLYQLVTPEHAAMLFREWASTSLQAELKKSLARLDPEQEITSEQVSYFQSGSFYPFGGLVLDAERRFALVQGSLDFRYRRDLLIKPLSLIRPTSWRGESWYEP
ncbi:hypothetical protein [Vibrio mangrovi]|uniref:Uncharacterized protein n=1 Tax=Vibrio mangrovi TaxID=474394 RepID=A0A1Y6ISV1_9VIBR|nr:hypothetical protein [Vibrio mangrovi]MDW6003330.1 hypothetical protein [Vibrio mangrovi]SMR99880.1 hypothetical protein VIM7927_01115 [Vibrio mangrovi]